MAKGKSIRTIAVYEKIIRQLGRFRVVHAFPTDVNDLISLGFSSQPNEGDSVLPASLGKISEFNSNGKVIIRKDLPKVSESRMGWREWKDWHGNPHSGIQIRTTKIYPRELVLPPSEYLTVLPSPMGLLVCSRPLTLTQDSEEAIVHVINLYLELFGDLQIVDEKLENAAAIQVKRLNWKVLPPGPYPFARAKQELSEFINGLAPEVKPVIEDRIKAITHYNPDFIAVGIGGFKDYVVFGFSKNDTYVLESPSIGNATYIFKNDWQELSLRTKKEILDGSLHEARIIHNHRWRVGIRDVIQKKSDRWFGFFVIIIFTKNRIICRCLSIEYMPC